MGTLLADFPTPAAVAPSATAAAAASSARVPRRQNAGSEGQRSWLRSRLRDRRESVARDYHPSVSFRITGRAGNRSDEKAGRSGRI
jgi:hypothetical protein